MHMYETTFNWLIIYIYTKFTLLQKKRKKKEKKKEKKKRHFVRSKGTRAKEMAN
jgi:hypothetical protein